MGKRTRWQPPHPPKDIGVPPRQAPPRIEPEPEWRIIHQIRELKNAPAPWSDDGRHLSRLTTDQPWCVWPTCERPKHDGLQLCRVHTRVVVEHHTRAQRAAAEEAQQRAAEQRQRLAEAEEAQQRAAEQRQRLAEAEEAINNGQKHKSGPIPGWCYLVKVDDLIKIGYTKNPWQRLRAYPPNAEVLAVFPGTKVLEKDLHGRFRFALRKGREWFRDAPEIREYVAEVVGMYGPPYKEFTDRYRDANTVKQYVGAKRNTGIKKTAA